jgi:hypothetical protein
MMVVVGQGADGGSDGKGNMVVVVVVGEMVAKVMVWCGSDLFPPPPIAQEGVPATAPAAGSWLQSENRPSLWPSRAQNDRVPLKGRSTGKQGWKQGMDS